MINTMIIEIVDNVFVILLDNSSSAPFSLGVLDEREVGVVVATVTVVVATVGNGATDVVLAIDTDAADVAAVDTGADVVTASFVVVVGATVEVVSATVEVVGATVEVVGAAVVVISAAAVVVGFNTQIRLVVRLPLNEMYSL